MEPRLHEYPPLPPPGPRERLGAWCDRHPVLRVFVAAGMAAAYPFLGLAVGCLFSAAVVWDTLRGRSPV